MPGKVENQREQDEAGGGRGQGDLEAKARCVRFDRGDNVNALSMAAIRELTDAARSFEDDVDTSVVVLTGTARAFSAGFDLKEPAGKARGTLPRGQVLQMRAYMSASTRPKSSPGWSVALASRGTSSAQTTE